MRAQALFINGIFRNVLDEILKNQSEAPDKILFLQPDSGSPIVMLRDNPPTVEDPVILYASTTDGLATVSYTADIVGWEDKTKLERARRDEVTEIIRAFQCTEDGLCDKTPGRSSLNLLSIRKLDRLTPPFSVANLIKIRDGKPLSTNRSRSGGWSYVRRSTDSTPDF